MNALAATQSLGHFIPELMLIGTILLVFIVDLMLDKDAPREAYAAGISAFGLVATLVSSLAQWHLPVQAIFSGMIVVDPFAVFFKVLILAATLAVLVFLYKSDELVSDAPGESYALLLVVSLSAMLLSSANNLLMVYLAFEGISLVSYTLAGMSRANRRASEAALKYVIYGGVASGVMLFGFSYIYGITGTLDLTIMRERLLAMSGALGQGQVLSLAMTVAVSLVLVGIAYKIAAAPFHQWSPDVYEGSPTPIAAYFSVVPKAAGIALIIRFFTVGFTQIGLDGSFSQVSTVPWVGLLGVMAAATMTVGNFGALAQTNLKRLLAYSSIGHAGYMLMGLVVLGRNGLSAVLFYMAVYAVMNLGAFFSVVALRKVTGHEDLRAVRGLGYRAPVTALAFTIFLVSLTGLPPMAGFIGKYFLFASVLEGGGFWLNALVLVAVINSAVSLFYYSKVFREMFLREPSHKSAVSIPKLQLATLVLLAAVTLILGFVSFGITGLKTTSDDALHLSGHQVIPQVQVVQK